MVVEDKHARIYKKTAIYEEHGLSFPSFVIYTFSPYTQHHLRDNTDYQLQQPGESQVRCKTGIIRPSCVQNSVAPNKNKKVGSEIVRAVQALLSLLASLTVDS